MSLFATLFFGTLIIICVLTAAHFVEKESNIASSIFTINVSSHDNKPNLAVSFTDTSTNSPLSWDWSFKDYGNQTRITTHFSTQKNPVYTFGAGNFSVTLTTRNATVSTTSAPVFINISAGVTREGISLTGFHVWPADHIFNTPVEALPLDPMSSVYTGNMSGGYTTSYLYIAKIIPISLVDANITKTPPLDVLNYPSSGTVFPIPDYAEVEEDAGTDHAMMLYNPDEHTIDNLYASFEPRQPNGTYYFSQTTHYNLTQYNLGPIGSRTDPPLLRYDEAVAGNISHAVGVAVYQTQSKNIWPGVQNDGQYANPSYPPIGERFRLRQSFDISGYTVQQQHILNGLKNYGMIVTDNTGTSSFVGIPVEDNPSWDFTFSTFSDIRMSDFEAVDESGLMINQSSGQARTIPII